MATSKGTGNNSRLMPYLVAIFAILLVAYVLKLLGVI